MTAHQNYGQKMAYAAKETIVATPSLSHSNLGSFAATEQTFPPNSSMAGQPADGHLVEMKPHPVLFSRCVTQENIQQISILKPSTHTE